MLRYQATAKSNSLDLNIFDVDETERAGYVKKSHERTERLRNPNAAPSKRGSWFLLIVIATCVLAALVIYISGQIQVVEVHAETSAVAARLDESMRENARLQAKLEGMATPARVEEFAAENGLVRGHVAQITHIVVNVESVIEVAEADNSGFTGTIGSWFDSALEFLGF